MAGTDSYNSSTGVYTIQGSGADISGTLDAFHFVYQPLTADGELEARLVSMQNTNGSAKAGLMIRQDTTAGSIFSMIDVSPNYQIKFTNRTAVGASTGYTTPGTSNAPYWLKIVKDGTLISAFISPDGSTWTYAGNQRLSLTSPVDIGFGVTSHNNSVLCTAVFDNITFTAQTTFAPSSPWSNQDIGSPGKAGADHVEQNQWSLFGGGAGVTGTSDQFHYTYQTLSGDGVVVAQVAGVSSGSTTSAGVLMRQDLTSGSTEAGILLNGTNGIRFVTRATAGVTLNSVSGGAYTTPYWVKLIRAGNLFSGYQSPDGTTWTQVGTSQTITMTGPIYIGLAATSGNNNTLDLAVLDNVSVPAAPPTFSPGGGTYASAQTITLSSTTSRATIYYTTDGSTPTTSSSFVASGGTITANQSETINAIAAASGYTSSSVASAVYTIQISTAAAPTFSPVAGTYTSAQTVTLSSTTASATIYYTTDGSTPTTSSFSVASGGTISVAASETVKAMATASGYTNSSVASATYTIQVPAATPTFSPVAGTYTSAQTVTLSSTTASATIYYTTNGSTPTTSSSSVASGGTISVTASETVKAMATASGYTNSAVASAAYTIQVPAATPTFSPVAGTYTSAQTVALSSTTTGATIYYTTNGSTPTTSSSSVASGGTISVAASETVKAMATASGYTNSAVASAAYTIQVPTASAPTFSPVAGTYTSAQTVALSSTTTGATIYYTTDGSTPTSSSSSIASGGSISVSQSETINAMAVASGYNNSSVASAAYTIQTSSQGWNSIDIGSVVLTGSDSYNSSTGVYTVTGCGADIAGTADAFHYVYQSLAGDGSLQAEVFSMQNTNGSAKAGVMIRQDNTPGSIFSMLDVTPNNQIKFTNRTVVGASTGYTTPGTSNAPYWVKIVKAGTLITVFLSPDGVTWTAGGQVTLSFTSPAEIGFAVTSHNTSATCTALFENITLIGGGGGAVAATPTFNPVAGTYTSAQMVALTSTTTGATIYYTTDGSTPTTSSSSVASGGTISVAASETVKAIAMASGYTNSAVASAAYTIQVPAATPTFSPVAGTYTSAQTVALSSTTSGATIYYTTDGSTPTTSSSSVASGGTISIAASETVKAIATASGFSNSAVASAAYTIQGSALPVTSGLAAWFNAGVGIATNSGSVTQWNDQSGNQYNVTQTPSANAPTVSTDLPSGQTVLNFNGGQWLRSTAMLTGVNDVTIITVSSHAISTNYGASVVVGDAYQAGAGRVCNDDFGKQSYADGANIGDGGSFPNTGLLNVATLTYSQSSGLASFYSQGQANGTATVNSSVLNAGLSIGPYGPYLQWNGNIAEVIVYNHVLTTSDRQQVEGYLANKYGIYAPGASWINSYTPAVQAEINRNLWNKNQADAYVSFQNANSSMLTNGLKLWLKADAGIALMDTNEVLTWVDQTGNYTFNQSSSYNYFRPTLVGNDSNGMPAVHFRGDPLSSPTSLGVGANADMTVIAVGMTTAQPFAEYSFDAGNGTTGATRALGFRNSAQFFDTTGVTAPGGAAPANYVFTAEGASVNSTRSSVTFYRNGTQTGTGALTGVVNPSGGIAVGTSWQGDISEVLVYDHQLSSSELQQVSLYLANKYGTYYSGASWITGSGYTSAVQLLINTNLWSKAQADAYVQASIILPVANGLFAWFKADSGVQTDESGKAVDTWLDSSGNHNDVSCVSNAPVLTADAASGTPTVAFSLGQALSSSNSYPAVTNSTIIVMASTPTPSALAFAPLVTFGNPVNNGNVSGLAYNWENLGSQYTAHESFWTGSFLYKDGGPLPSTSSLTSTAISYSNGTASFYCNGIANGTLTDSDGSFSNGLSLGSSNWLGNISEVLVYNRALSSSEIQQIQTYLAAKYAPYSVAAPTFSPVGGSNITPSTNISLSGATSPAVIRYTTDGSVPTSSSPQYAAPFTLSQDGQVVTAAIFNANTQISPLGTAQFWIGDTYHIGIPDTWQTQYLGSVTNLNPNALAPGGSGLTYLQAYQLGYNPTMYSTNGDGLSDAENHLLGYAGNNLDINNYGLTNAQQLALGLDPFNTTTNPPLPTPPTPNPNDHTPPVITLVNPQGAVQF